MQTLLDTVSHKYFITDFNKYKNIRIRTNVNNFAMGSDFIKCYKQTQNVTHMLCAYNLFDYSLFQFPLLNLKYLELQSVPMESSKIDISFCPNLKILVLNVMDGNNKFFHNLSPDIKILILKISHFNLDFTPGDVLLFDNLPVGLETIVFHYERVHEYLIYSKNIMECIKKYKIPFGCKIYFCAGDDIHSVEEL